MPVRCSFSCWAHVPLVGSKNLDTPGAPPVRMFFPMFSTHCLQPEWNMGKAIFICVSSERWLVDNHTHSVSSPGCVQCLMFLLRPGVMPPYCCFCVCSRLCHLLSSPRLGRPLCPVFSEKSGFIFRIQGSPHIPPYVPWIVLPACPSCHKTLPWS